MRENNLFIGSLVPNLRNLYKKKVQNAEKIVGAGFPRPCLPVRVGGPDPYEVSVARFLKMSQHLNLIGF